MPVSASDFLVWAVGHYASSRAFADITCQSADCSALPTRKQLAGTFFRLTGSQFPLQGSRYR